MSMFVCNVYVCMSYISCYAYNDMVIVAMHEVMMGGGYGHALMTG